MFGNVAAHGDKGDANGPVRIDSGSDQVRYPVSRPSRSGFLRLCAAIVLGLAVGASSASALEKKEYRIFIVTDTVDDWSSDIIKGFKETMDRLLAAGGARAAYTLADTKLQSAVAAGIVKQIEAAHPDLICVVNYPSGFADSAITKVLTDPRYKFVSENAIPEESGVIGDWAKPGGNVTGVSVFLQQNSQLKLMKRLNPQVRKFAFGSWDAMVPINSWFEKELRRAAREEGLELVEFRRFASAEEEFAFLSEYDKKGQDHFVMIGVSAFVHRDGSAADMSKEEPLFIRQNLRRLQMINYDESTIKSGYLGGACVIWSDIGAQLAEKGLLVLNGRSPGDIPWEYPRTYNIILNNRRAQDIGLTIPQELIGAAYRVYTDYTGTYVGR